MSHTILILLGSMALVFVAALTFVNAIEWTGYKLHLGGSFVSAILSPLFTSLPELIVILVALFAYTEKSGEAIGIGTIFGEPLMVSSLSYGLVGIAVLMAYLIKRRESAVLVIDKTLIIPYVFITILFPLTLVPSIIHIKAVNYIFGFIFVGTFMFYMWLMYRRRMVEAIDDAEQPYLLRIAPKTVHNQIAIAVVQLVIAVSLLYIGSEKMVGSVNDLARSINVSPMGLALIVIPAATAIPETISALIWGYRGKDTLSVGALVGEKVLYCTIYPALGLFLTSWALDVHARLSVLFTTIVSLMMLGFIARQRLSWYSLCLGVFFFVGYSILVLLFRV